LKKVNLLIFILFLNLCSTTSNEGVASLSESTTTSLVIAEEDYPVVLTQCLNKEKGYNIATPFDIEDLKMTISQLSNNKDEELKLGEDVNYCISKYNLWSDSSSANPEELAKLYDENLELAKCLREKGLNVPDPSQQEPKVDLSGLKESKDDIMPLLQECGWQK
jgi:cold shock CspA family protein